VCESEICEIIRNKQASGKAKQFRSGQFVNKKQSVVWPCFWLVTLPVLQKSVFKNANKYATVFVIHHFLGQLLYVLDFVLLYMSTGLADRNTKTTCHAFFLPGPAGTGTSPS
jgi:hypothetical protein